MSVSTVNISRLASMILLGLASFCMSAKYLSAQQPNGRDQELEAEILLGAAQTTYSEATWKRR